MKMKHDLSRSEDSTRNVHVVWQDSSTSIKKGMEKWIKLQVHSFLPFQVVHMAGRELAGHRYVLVEGCLCASTILYAAIN